MKIGISGCSHSARYWGNPWHHYMGLRLNAEIVESWSPGAGNEMNFEKVKYILGTHPDLDLFVFQVTEPARLVVGLNDVDASMIKEKISVDTTLPSEFSGSFYYTFNPDNNEDNLKRMLNKDIKVDNFIIKHSFISDYNLKFKVFHTILGLQQLCTIYGKKIIFFSWMIDLHKLAKSCGYYDLIKNLNITDGCVDDFVLKNNIERIPNDGHFNSINSERIYNEYIHDRILKFI